jgi:uncharacterized protein YjbI with pentapeptide repeats
MPIPTNEQITRWRKRWAKHPGLADEITNILLPEGKPAADNKEAAERMWRVNERLKKVNGRLVNKRLKALTDPEFDVYAGEGEPLGDAKCPVLDLRGIGGIDWKKKKLRQISLPEAHIEGANLRYAHLEGADLHEAHLEWAELHKAHLEGANLNSAHLEWTFLDEAHLEGADLSYAHLKGANLNLAHFEGAKLLMAHLEGAELKFANLVGADLSLVNLEGADLSDAFLEGANFARVETGVWEGEERDHWIGRRTKFRDNEFLPRYSFSMGWKKFWRLLTNRWFYTNFYWVQIDNADTFGAADLYRYVKDQQYIARLRYRSRFFYHLWNWTTSCGHAAWRVAMLSLITIVFFGFLFAGSSLWLTVSLGLMALPVGLYIGGRFKKFKRGQSSEELWGLVFGSLVAVRFITSIQWYLWSHGVPPLVDFSHNPQVSDAMAWFFISFDIFTNLGIRTASVPLCDSGVIAIFLETVLGWTSLGLLISVFTTKITRRS